MNKKTQSDSGELKEFEDSDTLHYVIEMLGTLNLTIFYKIKEYPTMNLHCLRLQLFCKVIKLFIFKLGLYVSHIPARLSHTRF